MPRLPFFKHKIMKLPNIPELIPFAETSRTRKLMVSIGWVLFVVTIWFVSGIGDKHTFPTPGQVWKGLGDLYNEGLITHIASSLALCGKAVFISIFVSLGFAYISTLPLFKPVATMISKFRYLPLTGISFYITMLLDDGRSIQVWILVTFMTTFLITSLMAMIEDIPEEEFNHARTLGYNRWQVLLEIVIKGRIDYVIEVIRQNLAIVWMMLVTVESILASAGGLGFLIKNSDKFMNHGRIIALQLVILMVGLLLDFILTRTRKLLFRYSKI